MTGRPEHPDEDEKAAAEQTAGRPERKHKEAQ
jgi:hypothetical protein